MKQSNRNWKNLNYSEVLMMIPEFSKMKQTKNLTQSSLVWCRKSHNRSKVISNPEKREELKPLVKSSTIKCSQVQPLFPLQIDARPDPFSRLRWWVHQTTENWAAEATIEKLFLVKMHYKAGLEIAWIQTEIPTEIRRLLLLGTFSWRVD